MPISSNSENAMMLIVRIVFSDSFFMVAHFVLLIFLRLLQFIDFQIVAVVNCANTHVSRNSNHAK
jgi:hypothetical protein